MSGAWRKYLTGLLLALAAGAAAGYAFGRVESGLLVIALLIVAWQVRQLAVLDRALQGGRFSGIATRSAFWSQVFARLERLAQRGQKHKKRHRRLLREVRNSTAAMPDGAIILDDTCRIVLGNPAAQKLVGFNPRLDRGQRVDHLLRNPRFVEYLNSGAEGDGIEIQSPVTDDDWLYCRIVPYGQDQRLLLVRDVTERVRLNKMRRDFVANASHELRSPLTVISGYLDGLIGDPEVPADWRRPLRHMQSQAGRMNKIVAELIELSRLETSGVAPDDQVVDVATRIASACRMYDDTPDIAAIQADIETDARLLGSDSDIDSLINNLLSNAVRHTDGDGRIVVRWADNEDGALLSVTDDGEGIAESHIPRLTERFFRVDKGRSRDDGGVGLGLAIVKYALGRHGAELRIESQVGKGSTFACYFPPHRIVRPESRASAGAG